MPEKIDASLQGASSTLSGIEKTLIEGEVIEVLRAIYDPEIPVNIYDLGLIYEIMVANDKSVHIQMTLTSPACPVAESLPTQVQEAVRAVPGVTNARVELVWDPPYSIDKMPDHVKLQLGLL